MLIATVSVAQRDTLVSGGDTSAFELRSFDNAHLEAYRADVDFDYVEEIKEPNAVQMWLAEMRRRINEWFNSQNITNNWVAIVISLVLFVVVVWFVLKNYGGVFDKADSRLDRRVNVFNEEISLNDISGLISQSEANGDYRAAFRWHFIELLSKLEENDWIRLRKSKTNRDYCREMSGHRAAGAFESLARDFDGVWYGGYPYTREQYAVSQDRISEVLNLNPAHDA